MSQFPQVPPPGAYEPPNPSLGAASGFNPQSQGQPYQQNPSPYQTQTPSPYVPPQQPQKTSSGGFGGIFNQAVTTGKPLLNKIGKTISSKVGGKHSTPTTPQHLESYQQYQGHQQQQQQQQQQWQQGAYPGSQQSPHPGSNYASPASGQSGQSNYFAPQQQQPHQQQTQPPNLPQSPQPQQGATPNYNNQYGGQAQNIGQPGQFQQDQQAQQTQGQFQGQTQAQQSQFQGQGLAQQNQFQDQSQQQSQFQPQAQSQGHADGHGNNTPVQGAGQAQQGQYPGQGEGQGQNTFFSGTGQPQQGQFQPQAQVPPGQYQGQTEGQNQTNLFPGTAPPHGGQFQQQPGGIVPLGTPQTVPTPPNMASPVTQHAQQHWIPPTPSPGNATIANQAPSPAPTQHTQHFVPTPPPQPFVAAPPAPPVPQHPNQPSQQQQWGPASPIASANHPVPSISPAPQQPTVNQNQVPSGVPGPAQPQDQTRPSTTTGPPPKSQPSSAPTQFIAELPADLGSLNLGDTPQTQSPPPSSPQLANQQQYQAYQPAHPGQSQTPPNQGQSFKVARRAVSMHSAPLADPWRIADPATEQPTREFFIIADLLFDGLDRKCEPQNTGILEASKILQTWNMQGFDDQAAELFRYESFSAFALLWTLQGVPHFMVPSQPSLTPSWTVETNHQALKIAPELPAPDISYPSYIPALNRAGWYKFLFLELVGEPELLEKMMPLFCSDTYKPNSPHHPDLARLEKNSDSHLSVRAKHIGSGAVGRVCEKVAAAMQQSHGGGQNEELLQQQALAQIQQDAALKMQALQVQQQMSNMVNQSIVQGGQSFSMAAGNTYVER